MSKEIDKRYNSLITVGTTRRCNFTCEYCFDSNEEKRSSKLEPINISNLLSSLDRLNKTFRVSFIGGEMFLVPNIIETCIEVSKKHYIHFNTNLVPNSVRKFADAIDPERVVSIQASLHMQELEKRGMIDAFITNYNYLKDKGFKISSVAVAHPSLLPEIEKFDTIFTDGGVDYEFGNFFGEYDGKQYPASYTKKELEAFDMSRGEGDPESNVEFYQRKGKRCNAGTNMFLLTPDSDDVYPCAAVPRRLGNLEEGFNPLESPIVCPADYCFCPTETNSQYLVDLVEGVEF